MAVDHIDLVADHRERVVNPRREIDAMLERVSEAAKFPRWFAPTPEFISDALFAFGMPLPQLFRHATAASMCEYWTGSAWRVHPGTTGDLAAQGPDLDATLQGVELGYLAEVDRARASALTGGNP